MGQLSRALGVTASIIGIILTSVAIWTTGWLRSAFVDKGLWKICVRFTNICQDIQWSGSSIYTITRGILIIAVICYVAAAILGCRQCSKMTEKKQHDLMATVGIFYCIAGSVTLIGALVFTGMSYSSTAAARGNSSTFFAQLTSDKFSYSFYLAWVGGILFIIGGISCRRSALFKQTGAKRIGQVQEQPTVWSVQQNSHLAIHSRLHQPRQQVVFAREQSHPYNLQYPQLGYTYTESSRFPPQTYGHQPAYGFKV